MNMTVAVTDADIAGIPVSILRALIAWATKGERSGGFVMALLENNLAESCTRADQDSTDHLPAIVAFLLSDMPAPCWGSKEKCEEWEIECGDNSEWHGDTNRWEIAVKSSKARAR